MDSSEMSQGYVLAQNIKKLRSKLGLNQLQLAEKADLSIATIKQIETCVRWPRPETLEAIASALNVPSGQLLAGETLQPQPTIGALMNALNEMQKENERLRMGLPDELVKLWNQLDKYDRNTIIESLKVLVKDKEKSTSGESSGGTSA